MRGEALGMGLEVRVGLGGFHSSRSRSMKMARDHDCQSVETSDTEGDRPTRRSAIYRDWERAKRQPRRGGA